MGSMASAVSPAAGERGRRPPRDADEARALAGERYVWSAFLLVVAVLTIAFAGYTFRAVGVGHPEWLEHLLGLSAIFVVVALAALVFRHYRWLHDRRLSLAALMAGAGLGSLACLLYLKAEATLSAGLVLGVLLTGAFLMEHAGRRLIRELGLGQLRWLIVLTPPGYIVAITATLYALHFRGAIPHKAEHTLLTATLLVGSFPFAIFVSRVFERIRAEIVKQRDELADLHQEATRRSGQLRALNEAGFDLTSELSLELRAQLIVDLGRELSGASDGSLVLLSESGEPQSVLIRGTRCRQMTGRLLNWEDAERLRCDCDFCDRLMPASEPSMETSHDTITARLHWQADTLGVLTLVNADGRAFRPEDREVIDMYVQWGALAIKNAQLFATVRSLAVIEERDRIAREMHDNFGQMLGYINTKAQAVQLLLQSRRYAEASQQITDLEGTTQELYEDVREAISGLRGAHLLERGLVEGLTAYAQQFEETSGIETIVKADHGSVGNLPLDVELQVFRIVQEALTNVRKHAGSPDAMIRVARQGNELHVRVVDRGRGFEPDVVGDGHFGLKTMRERAEALGGSLIVASVPERGTEVALIVPLDGRKDT